MTIMPELDPELCNGCGLCIVACHGGGIVKQGNKIKIVETENCDFCGICEAACFEHALKCVYSITSSED